MVKSKTRLLEIKADKLFQKWFISRNPKCLICGLPANCGHHYIPKSQSNFLRYQERNMIPICAGCHTRHHLSGDPHIMATILKIKGQDWHDELHQVRHIPQKMLVEYLKGVIKEYSQEDKTK